MSAIRTSRTRLARAAAIVVLSALSLTACNDGAGVNDEGSVGSSTAASPSESVPASEAPADGSPASSSSSSAAQPVPAGSKPAANAPATNAPATNAPATKPPVSSGKPVTCEGSNTKTVAAPLNRPVNHMLLTVTNTGSKPCYLYTYPALRFGEAQAVPPVLKDSQPQAVVTLGPGESGYASVNLSAADGSGSHGRTEKSLTVYFHGPSGNESVGAGAHPSLPATGVYIDDSLNVTYWQQSMDDALTW
ncbi:DUF4232 domain-containing protein [Streptomyces sp. NPDC088770]|uniref:DUF4232 domain-containing protein n=1 Tax=Streptomyces sp. NPDC088770 TaxID=3365895 RepID=UPI0038302215